jgi:CDP-diacylglycerol--glycerol-3-phosphate 3-phosphatidyltransferase
MLCSAAVFLLASVTDWLDGYIARAYDAESILGKLLDPLADKILVMSALVMLAAHPMGPKVPTWVVVILLAREFLVMGLRSLAAVKGSVVAASYWAKQKTGWTLAGITCLLIDRSYAFLGLELNFHFIGTLLIFLALILSVVSGTQYALRFKRLLFEG